MRIATDKVKELRDQGLSYKEIEKILNISKGTISYHLNPSIKAKQAERRKIRREKNPIANRIAKKVDRFRKHTNEKYGTKDVMKRLVEKPFCYLTGLAIDLSNTESWNLDHIIPKSKGGNGDLSNIGLTHSKANMMKGDLFLDEFIELCRKVLENNGHNVT